LRRSQEAQSIAHTRLKAPRWIDGIRNFKIDLR
jgi:hypothetical protein